MSSTQSAASSLGLTSGQFKQALNSGNTLFDLLQGGTGRLGNYYKTLLNNPEYAYQYQDELTQGLDTSSVQLVNQIVQLQREGKLTNDLINDFKNMTSAELDKALDDYKDSVSTTEKVLNTIGNTFDQLTSWNWWSGVQNNVQGILNLLMVISGILSVKSSIGNITSLFKGAGTATGAASAAGAAKGVGAGAAGLAKYLPAIGAGVWMGVDAYQGFTTSQNTGWAKAGDTLATMISGTGTNLGGSILSGAGKGALIGTAIAPGIGTAVGAAIGGGLGLAANFWKTEQAKKQQDTLDRIADNTKSTADATKSLSVGDRFMKSVIPMGGDEYGYSTGRTYSHVPKPSLPWGSITSWYGTRTNPITGAKGSFHSGIDIGAKAGTAIGAAYNGTVVGKGHNSSMGNWISVKDDNGKTHTYMHMISGALPEVGDYVSQGQVVGYIGSTGNSTGPHLHYSVNTGSGYNRTTTVDPYEYMLNSGIFGSTSSSVSTSSSSTSTSSSSMLDKVSQLIQMDAIGGDTGNPVVNSIQDLKQTIIDLSNRTTANEKLMRSIAGTYARDPRVG
jgi:murein DD-endopeptidase MepM/ murein hydrolase activator NlpD